MATGWAKSPAVLPAQAASGKPQQQLFPNHLVQAQAFALVETDFGLVQADRHLATVLNHRHRIEKQVEPGVEVHLQLDEAPIARMPQMGRNPTANANWPDTVPVEQFSYTGGLDRLRHAPGMRQLQQRRLNPGVEP